MRYRTSLLGSPRIEPDGAGGHERVVSVQEDNYDAAQLERQRALDDGRSV